MDLELSLADAITDPPEAHVHGFGAFGFDRVIGDTRSCGVVAFDDGWWYDEMMRYLNYEQMAVLVYLYRLVISEWSDASRSTFEQAGSHASLVE